MSHTVTLPLERKRAKPYDFGEALIFEMTIGQALDNHIDPELQECAYSLLTHENLRRFFSDPPMLAEFSRFLEHGFAGICAHQGDQWISVMWMTRPSTRQPLHMPRAVRGTYWIFSTRTHDAYRSRGYAKAALKAFALALDLADRRDERFYADVDPKNEPSRRALLGFGFSPAGSMLTLSVPRLKIFWGLWRRGLAHPALKSK
ncbi:MAG TPA: GNAT family N-acetyltransferase [Oscillatoriaceae cyanobacterium]